MNKSLITAIRGVGNAGSCGCVPSADSKPVYDINASGFTLIMPQVGASVSFVSELKRDDVPNEEIGNSIYLLLHERIVSYV